MSYTTEEKVQALYRLATFLDTLPEEQYDHYQFGRVDANGCNTPSCSLGWYVNNNPNEPLKFENQDGGWLDVVPLDDGDFFPYFKEIFTDDVTGELFNKPITRTPSYQAALIRGALNDAGRKEIS